MAGLGISGVPFYIINNKYGVSGAQPAETFVGAFREISQESVQAETGACDIDGKNC
jgi:predicted DsbA family dithiol-disulfide isomerase